jgi:hypothetical protein
MPHALESRPVKPSDVTLINHQYLSSGNKPDSTIVWGTNVDAEGLSAFVEQHNRTAGTLISVAHVLIGAVGRSLACYPRLNCRVIGSRIYRFREVNVRMICYDRRRNDVDILMIERADQVSVEEIARLAWNRQLKIAAARNDDRIEKKLLSWGPDWSRRWGSRLFWWLDRHFRLPRVGQFDRQLDSAVVVNHLGFANAPPMTMYKPSKFPDESSLLSITLGRIEQQPVVHEGRVVVRRVAPLFIRADHRVTDAYLLAQFIGTLRESLANPKTMEVGSSDVRSNQYEAA